MWIPGAEFGKDGVVQCALVLPPLKKKENMLGLAYQRDGRDQI